MQIRTVIWTVLVLALVVAGTTGCRSSRRAAIVARRSQSGRIQRAGGPAPMGSGSEGIMATVMRTFLCDEDEILFMAGAIAFNLIIALFPLVILGIGIVGFVLARFGSPEEAGAYLRQLRSIVRYLGICDGNLEEGSFRCDANVSIRAAGEQKLGTRTELKNLNSFKHVEKALRIANTGNRVHTCTSRICQRSPGGLARQRQQFRIAMHHGVTIIEFRAEADDQVDAFQA